MPVLLAAEDISGASEFQIECGNLEAGAEIAELLQRRKSLSRNIAQFGVGGYEQISIRTAV